MLFFNSLVSQKYEKTVESALQMDTAISLKLKGRPNLNKKLKGRIHGLVK